MQTIKITPGAESFAEALGYTEEQANTIFMDYLADYLLVAKRIIIDDDGTIADFMVKAREIAGKDEQLFALLSIHWTTHFQDDFTTDDPLRQMGFAAAMKKAVVNEAGLRREAAAYLHTDLFNRKR